MDKKAVALITLHYVKNYGSILQTYATQTILEELGCSVKTIDYRRPWETGLGYWFFLPEGGLKDFARQVVYFPSKIKQKWIFDKFLQKYINLTKTVYTSEKDFEKNPVNADIFCSGSDQVWNSGWNNGVIPAYFLSFVPDGSRCVSYASSFGVDSLGDDAGLIKGYLKRYSNISVRERSSIGILESMEIYDGTVVLDPTLQMEKEKWFELIMSEDIVSDYVLLIQLNRNRKFDQFALDYAKSRNKRLLRLCLRLDQCILSGEHLMIPAVEDYLRYIKCADTVLTDSFHAVSFALNFNKDFYCVLPEKYNTRLKSILRITGLESRVINNYCLDNSQDVKVDYTRVNPIIAEERLKSRTYLLDAFR